MQVSRCDSPFCEAAYYYDRFRPPYALEAFEHIAKVFGLAEGVRVIDLGCGPGTIAIPLSRLGAEITAVDTDENMLNEGRRLAAAHGAGKICWVHGRAEEVLSRPGQFRLVTFGQSLHWMDRDFVLRGLAAVVENDGGLAIVDVGGRSPESWEPIVAPVLAKHCGNRRRHPLKHREMQHEPSLRRSAYFSRYTVRVFPVEFTRDFESVLGCVYSGVNVSKAELGDRARAFEREVFEALARANPAGQFREKLETVVIVAKKDERHG
jgi:ubiquinone/menaquinone biosynthesis C-methylase UbiE